MLPDFPRSLHFGLAKPLHAQVPRPVPRPPARRPESHGSFSSTSRRRTHQALSCFHSRRSCDPNSLTTTLPWTNRTRGKPHELKAIQCHVRETQSADWAEVRAGGGGVTLLFISGADPYSLQLLGRGADGLSVAIFSRAHLLGWVSELIPLKLRMWYSPNTQETLAHINAKTENKM